MRPDRLLSYSEHIHSTLKWFLTGKRARSEAARIVEKLRRDGIAITSVEKLGLNDSLIQELYRESEKLAISQDALNLGRSTGDDINSRRV